MMIARKDGTLVWYPSERAVVLNPSATVHETTLENGVAIRMTCHWGEKVLVGDLDLVRAARVAEGLDEVGEQGFPTS
jgi:hypothetical protein